MKHIKTIAFIAIAICSFTLISFKTVDTIVKVSWVKDSHDFGEIPQGKPVTVEFSFKNEGNEPLVVEDVQTTCGCTASDYTKEPIAPGKSSKVKVTYNAAALGAFTKTATVRFSDASINKQLNIKGTVK